MESPGGAVGVRQEFPLCVGAQVFVSNLFRRQEPLVFGSLVDFDVLSVLFTFPRPCLPGFLQSCLFNLRFRGTEVSLLVDTSKYDTVEGRGMDPYWCKPRTQPEKSSLTRYGDQATHVSCWNRVLSRSTRVKACVLLLWVLTILSDAMGVLIRRRMCFSYAKSR